MFNISLLWNSNLALKLRRHRAREYVTDITIHGEAILQLQVEVREMQRCERTVSKGPMQNRKCPLNHQDRNYAGQSIKNAYHPIKQSKPSSKSIDRSPSRMISRAAISRTVRAIVFCWETFVDESVMIHSQGRPLLP